MTILYNITMLETTEEFALCIDELSHHTYTTDDSKVADEIFNYLSDYSEDHTGDGEIYSFPKLYEINLGDTSIDEEARAKFDTLESVKNDLQVDDEEEDEQDDQSCD